MIINFVGKFKTTTHFFIFVFRLISIESSVQDLETHDSSMSTLYIIITCSTVYQKTSMDCFFTQFTENKATLRNYRIVKRILAVAYLAVAVGSLPELW